MVFPSEAANRSSMDMVFSVGSKISSRLLTSPSNVIVTDRACRRKTASARRSCALK